MNKAAWFTLAHHVGFGAVEKIDVLSALQKSIEVVCIDSIFLMESGKAESSLQIVWNQRVKASSRRKDPLVCRKENNPFKVKVSSLQNTEYLQSTQGFSVECNGSTLSQARIYFEENAQVFNKMILLLYLQ